MKVLKNFTHFQSSIKNQKFKLSQIPVTGETVNLQPNQSIGLKVLRHSNMQRCNKLIKSYPIQEVGRHLVFYSWYFSSAIISIAMFTYLWTVQPVAGTDSAVDPDTGEVVESDAAAAVALAAAAVSPEKGPIQDN